MKNVIDIEAEVLGTETRKPVRNWFNLLTTVLWTVVVVVTFPVRILFRPLTKRVVNYAAPRVEAIRQRPIIITTAQGLGLMALVWLTFLFLTHVLYAAGVSPDGRATEMGKRSSYWAKQAARSAADGEIVEAGSAGFKYLINAERPNVAVRAGSAIGHFFK